MKARLRHPLAATLLLLASLAHAQTYSVSAYTGGVPVGSENWTLSQPTSSTYTVTNKLTGASRSLDVDIPADSHIYIDKVNINGQGDVLFSYRDARSSLNYTTFTLWSATGLTSAGGGTDASGSFTPDGLVRTTTFNPSHRLDHQLFANGQAYAIGQSTTSFVVGPNGEVTASILVSAPMDVNAAGTVAGVNRNMAALLPVNGAISYLPGTGSESSANSINNAGMVVGTGITAANQNFAFIWSTDQGTRDLNQLISPQSQLAGQVQLDSADYISEDGSQILAYGHYLSDANATRTAFMLSSVPEPSSWALMGLGLAGLMLARRRQAAA